MTQSESVIRKVQLAKARSDNWLPQLDNWLAGEDNWLPESDNWLTKSDNWLPQPDNCTGNTCIHLHRILHFFN